MVALVSPYYASLNNIEETTPTSDSQAPAEQSVPVNDTTSTSPAIAPKAKKMTSAQLAMLDSQANDSSNTEKPAEGKQAEPRSAHSDPLTIHVKMLDGGDGYAYSTHGGKLPLGATLLILFDATADNRWNQHVNLTLVEDEITGFIRYHEGGHPDLTYPAKILPGKSPGQFIFKVDKLPASKGWECIVNVHSVKYGDYSKNLLTVHIIPPRQ
jgi:hypothetical protein